ncbi:palmitoyltransferase ZDHHC4 isoform X2 [Protopterus annectens]|nr:palmitoyltransferase ZDHHC4 isoform X2 [Protopterus annectens]XP_043931686.1 palmitoyltransferase ZDHHC4 isoform X2 [Protopterus annectens]XP_043931687.1 palmitoyltransferase ZDHHC4 isoform X2 [Protopterus annectens]
MDFLTLFIIYTVFVLGSFIMVMNCSGREQFLQSCVNNLSKITACVLPVKLRCTACRMFNKVLYTRNPFFLVLHIVLEVVVYGEYTGELYGYCLEMEFTVLSLSIPYVLLMVKMIFFVMCCVKDPGTVTKSSQGFPLYSYDGVIYQEGIKCATCNLIKPARSKHCRLCNRCIHRFDHHCVWVNNCIGAVNMRYFLLYMLTLCAMAGDLAMLAVAFLQQLVLKSNLMQGSYIGEDGEPHPVDISFTIQHLFLTFPRVVFMLGFLIVVFLLLAGYLCFHLYLVLVNETSNEWFKKRQWNVIQSKHLKHKHKSAKCKSNYHRGVLGNIKEIFKPLTDVEKKHV